MTRSSEGRTVQLKTRTQPEGRLGNNVFLGMGFPGVEMIPGPRGSILHPTRASQLPYNAKL